MQLKLYVKEGYAAFEVEGILPEPPYKIVFNRPTRIVSMHFKKLPQLDIDCPIDDEMMNAIEDKGRCGIGCFLKGQKLATALVKFVQIYA